MDACQAINGHGGWPLNVFLTPDQTPFFAGTYFPREQRTGIPSWPMILEAVSDAWRDRPDTVREQGARMAQTIASHATLERDPQAGVPAERDHRLRAGARIELRSRPRRLGWGTEVPAALDT